MIFHKYFIELDIVEDTSEASRDTPEEFRQSQQAAGAFVDDAEDDDVFGSAGLNIAPILWGHSKICDTSPPPPCVTFFNFYDWFLGLNCFEIRKKVSVEALSCFVIKMFLPKALKTVF